MPTLLNEGRQFFVLESIEYILYHFIYDRHRFEKTKIKDEIIH